MKMSRFFKISTTITQHTTNLKVIIPTTPPFNSYYSIIIITTTTAYIPLLEWQFFIDVIFY